MADPAKQRTVYEQFLEVPDDRVAEIVNGELYVSPRPVGGHTVAASTLGFMLGPPFQFGGGNGPGGWHIFYEPELHLDGHILVPDLAGWGVERMPEIQRDSQFDVAPDWICEVLSPSTAALDRARKLPIYAACGVGHAWIVDPRARTVDIMRLYEGKWLIVAVHSGAEPVRAEPFEAIELDFSKLWAAVAPPPHSHAGEPGAAYDHAY